MSELNLSLNFMENIRLAILSLICDIDDAYNNKIDWHILRYNDVRKEGFDIFSIKYNAPSMLIAN